MTQSQSFLHMTSLLLGLLAVTLALSALPPDLRSRFRSLDRLVLRGLVFPRGRGNVRVSYQAGFASPPADLTQACIEMVSLRYREKDRVGLVSKGLAGETTAYSLKDMPESVRTLLSQYRRVVPA